MVYDVSNRTAKPEFKLFSTELFGWKKNLRSNLIPIIGLSDAGESESHATIPTMVCNEFVHRESHTGMPVRCTDREALSFSIIFREKTKTTYEKSYFFTFPV